MPSPTGARILTLIAFAVYPLCAQTPAPGTEFFEKEIRPVLAEKCYGCHSSKSKSPMGGLVLDTKSGLKKGGNGGPILVAGDPKASRLLGALTYNQTELRMPPTGKLPDEKIAAFEKWIAAGAPDPREETAGAAASPSTAKKGMDIETGRKWWAFQPVAPVPQPKVKNGAVAKRWSRDKIDWFIYANLEKNKLRPSPEADRVTLMERASLDLTGLRPSYAEVQAFAADPDPSAYEKLIERLLASQHYGERWGRYWLDVARYGEDNPTSEATNPGYPFAWRYRDWVIEAVNKDVPYDKFVKLQLAADLMPGTPRTDLRALGYLGAAPIYHTDLRLSKDVTETIFTDAWDERVDAVSRGLLGLTVGCARCHDHKFDPILTKDYYALAGMFASITAAPRPLAEVDKETDQKFMVTAQRLFYLSYMANLMNSEPGSKPEEAAQKCAQFTQEMLKTRDSMAFLKDSQPEMWAYLENQVKMPRLRLNAAKPAVVSSDAPAPKPAPMPVPAGARRRPGASDLPFMQSVFDAGVFIDGADPDLTKIDIRPGEAHDMHILPHGNVAAPGALAPRQFLTVLSKGDTTFKQGSGRLEFANDIFSQSGPLAARVIVNRVWGWHFGKPLVATESDFGVQGEKPVNPDLLSDLAARFVANGYSLKWLHREIMLSAAYRQSSHPRADGLAADPTNNLTWRMNPRRLDIEAYRDNLLQVSGDLETKAPALSPDLDLPTNHVRTVYGRVSRGRLNTVLALYDFPDPIMTAPQRELTTSPLQQLFVMNSPFMQERAADLVKRVEAEPDPSAKIRELYRTALNRNPTPKELDTVLTYLDKGTITQVAQALLASNEGNFLAMTLTDKQNKLSRRDWIASLSGGLGSLGLASMLSEGQLRAGSALAPATPKFPNFPAKAKHNIVLFMVGGPSQLDMFDYKPALLKYQGQRPSSVDLRTERTTGGLLPSPFEFKQHGRNGVHVSSLLPNLASTIDDICVIKSMYTFNPTHVPARNMFHTGNIAATRPSMGSWISYGLGSENKDLPGFVVLGPGQNSGGGLSRSGFLPSQHQGTNFDDSVTAPDKMIRYLQNKDLDKETQRRQLDLIQTMNRGHELQFGQDEYLEGRIQSMETAYTMQFEATDVFDINKEPEAVRKEYGDTPFAHGCLLARRLVERGVRTVHVYYGPGQPWDDHSHINKSLTERCPDMDQASAALVKDLRQRGLLGETLVVWGGEFGRTPVSESGDGRDHNPYGFTMWMAGGGVKGGISYGETDEFGFKAVEKSVSVHDLHATMLNQMGIDHTKLTYRYAGRDFRLTDVYGEVVRDILV